MRAALIVSMCSSPMSLTRPEYTSRSMFEACSFRPSLVSEFARHVRTMSMLSSDAGSRASLTRGRCPTTFSRRSLRSGTRPARCLRASLATSGTRRPFDARTRRRAYEDSLPRRAHKAFAHVRRTKTLIYLYLAVRRIQLPRHRVRVPRLDGLAQPSEPQRAAAPVQRSQTRLAAVRGFPVRSD